MESALRVHILPQLGELMLQEIGYVELSDYVLLKLRKPGAPKASGLSPKTVQNHLSYIRQVLVHAHKRELIEAVPEFDRPRAGQSKWDFLSFEESRLVILASEPHWQPIITVALNTGMRCGELLGLHWESVDLQRRELRVVHNWVRGEMTSPKSKRSVRTIPLNRAAIDALMRMPQDGKLVFQRSDGLPHSRHQLRKALARACRRAGVREVSPHTLRHTFASRLVMRKQTIKATQLLGHSTIQMTMRYAHLSPEIKHDAVAALDENFIATLLQ